MAYLMSAGYTDLYEGFLEALKPRVSERGYVMLKSTVRRVLAWLEEEELVPEELSVQGAVRFLAYLSETPKQNWDATATPSPMATGTMHNYIKAARRLFDYLVQTERRESNPFRAIPFPRLPERHCRNVLTEAQMGRLLRELADFNAPLVWYERERRYRVHVIAEFLYATGLRIAEACSLVPEDLDLPHRLVHLREGKGGKPRTAFLTPYAVSVLELYLKKGRARLSHQFTRSERCAGTLFCATHSRVSLILNDELAKLCPALGLPLITSHGFRHSLGTHLLRAGCDMRHIQVILGHESLGATEVYTHVDKDDLKKSLDTFHPRQWAHDDAKRVVVEAIP